MRKSIFIIISTIFGMVLAQDAPTIASVDYLRVKPGKDAAFEKAVATHVSKWHGQGQWSQFGFKVTNGPRAGMYVIGTSGHYWKDYSERVTTKSHDKDWDNIINSFVIKSEGGSFWTYKPELSYKDQLLPMVQITYYYYKPGALENMMAIMKKYKSANEKADYEKSYGIYTKASGGLDQVWIFVGRMNDLSGLVPIQFYS